MSSVGDSSPAQQTIPHRKHACAFFTQSLLYVYFFYSKMYIKIDSQGLYIEKYGLSTYCVEGAFHFAAPSCAKTPHLWVLSRIFFPPVLDEPLFSLSKISTESNRLTVYGGNVDPPKSARVAIPSIRATHQAQAFLTDAHKMESD